jgi:diguanylate cyclase (GGDEF)-like protein
LGSTLLSRNPGNGHDLKAAGPARRPALSLKALFAIAAGEGPARHLLRSILPAALILIGLIGLAALGGHRLGLLGIAVGASLFTLATAGTVAVVIGWSAWLLNAEHVERCRVQAEIELHALHDPLTGLANRGFFFDQLARRAALAGRRTSVPFAVCSLKLDGFARLVEQFGREAGNGILLKVAEVLRECVRASDLVARLDGDHFGILLEEIADAKDVNLLAQRIVSSVPRALVESADAPISVSIGIVLKTSGHDLPGEMLREADAALSAAKKRGPGRFELTAFADQHAEPLTRVAEDL